MENFPNDEEYTLHKGELGLVTDIAGPDPQLEMFQNPLNVMGRILGNTPLGVF
jgi:hypothetical protein